MSRPRVLYVLRDFPQLSQTYIKSELEAVQEDFELRVVALNRPDIPHDTSVPYIHETDPARILDEVRAYRPVLIHTHYLTTVPLVHSLCRQVGIPFTVRAHSTDSLRSPEGIRFLRSAPRPAPARRAALSVESVRRLVRRWYRRAAGPTTSLRSFAPLINDDLCLGLLSFPFTRPLLEGAGVRGDKIRECFPSIPYERFHNRDPNGSAIMGVGAYIPKKRTEDFLRLAKDVPDSVFNLYAFGYRIERLHALSRGMRSPAHIIEPLPPEAMPAEYKKHRWLVYTACPERASVGWPVAIAEAQASGVGVCMANVRADLRDYVGDAGFLYDTLAEARRIVTGPFPEDMRQRGFELARRSDIAGHKGRLTELWQRAVASAPRR
jgi:glycosyltransferase involved in cell wall biosynthesis